MNQPRLFDDEQRYTPPRQRHSATSTEAAERIEPNAQTLRGRILGLLREWGSDGLTDQQIQLMLEMDPNTERPRRVELQRMGLVIDSGRTRNTRSGRRATVWIATK